MGKDGEPIGIQGIGRDITENKRLEVALERSEEKYRHLIENANDGIVTVDLQGNFTLVNKMGERISGYRREELIGQPLSKLVCPEYLSVIFDRLKTRAHGKEVEYTYEIEIFNKNGERVPLEITTNLITRDGRPIGSQVIVRDITKRKRLEKALRGSEEKYRTLVESSSDAIFTVDTQGNFTFFNENVKNLIGFTSGELVGRNFVEILPPESKKKARKFFSRGMKGETGHTYELEVCKKDGGTATVELNMSTLFQDGKPIGRLGVARDITERKKLEEELRQIKEFNERIVNRMEEGIMIEDEAGRITFLNPAAEKLLGYKKEEVLGKHWRVVSHPNSIPKMDAETRKRPMGKSGRYEGALMTKEGKKVPILITATPLFENNVFKGVLSVFTDISEIKRAEEAIKRLSAAVESMKEYFTIADMDGKIVYVNPALERDYGYTKEELLGKHASILLSPDSPPELVEEIYKAALRGGWTGEVRNIAKDGRVFWVDMSTVLLKDKSGKPANIIAIARDITDRKKMEVKLEEKIKELERFNRLAVGRELKMIELKKRIRALEK